MGLNPRFKAYISPLILPFNQICNVVALSISTKKHCHNTTFLGDLNKTADFQVWIYLLIELSVCLNKNKEFNFEI